MRNCLQHHLRPAGNNLQTLFSAFLSYAHHKRPLLTTGKIISLFISCSIGQVSSSRIQKFKLLFDSFVFLPLLLPCSTDNKNHSCSTYKLIHFKWLIQILLQSVFPSVVNFFCYKKESVCLRAL